MHMRKVIVLAAVVVSAGCTQPGETTGMGAATGGVIGAGLGAIVGSQTGDAGAGLAIGAVAGSGTGALIGNALEAQEQMIRTQDEAIERQSRTIAAQRSEIEALRRLDRDTGTSPRGRYSPAPAARYPTSRTIIPPANRSPATVVPAPRPVTAARPMAGAAPVAPLRNEAAVPVKPQLTTPELIKPAEPVSPELPVQPVSPSVAGSGDAAAVKSTLSSAECRNAEQEIQLARGQADSANKLFHLRRALRLCPDNPAFHVALGEAYIDLNRLTDAEFEFHEALALDPNYEPAKQRLAQVEAPAR